MDTPVMRLVIVDDQPVFRLGLRHAVEEVSHIAVVGEFTTSEQTGALIAARHPDVALISVDGVHERGFDILQYLAHQAPEIAAIAMTSAENADELLEAVRSNAQAYISKFATSRDILRTIHRVHDGESPIHESVSAKHDVTKRLLREFQSMTGNAGQRGSSAPLSPREMDILRQLGQGYSNKEIGRSLGITEQTVKNHISSILRKLGVDDRMQAVLTGLRNHWITLGDGSLGPHTSALAVAAR